MDKRWISLALDKIFFGLDVDTVRFYFC